MYELCVNYRSFFELIIKYIYKFFQQISHPIIINFWKIKTNNPLKKTHSNLVVGVLINNHELKYPIPNDNFNKEFCSFQIDSKQSLASSGFKRVKLANEPKIIRSRPIPIENYTDTYQSMSRRPY